MLDNFKKKITSKIRSKLLSLTDEGKSESTRAILLMPNVIANKEITIDLSVNFNISPHATLFKIGKGFICRSFSNFLIHPHATLIINDGVFFNNYCSVNCLGKIEIGANTLFGEGVKLYDHNHKIEKKNSNLEVYRDDFTIGTIKIGENCWIGSNVTILKDVEIGDNVIVGANCLIYKSVPPNSIVKHTENLIIDSL